MKWLYIEFVILEPKYQIFPRTLSRDVDQSAFVIGLDLIKTRGLILPRRKLIVDYFHSKKSENLQVMLLICTIIILSMKEAIPRY